MGALGDDIAAAVLPSREKADEAWGILADAGIPATVVTDPGILGKYELLLMVDRADLEAAQEALGPFMEKLSS